MNAIAIIIYLVNKEVIEPIQEMSKMTAFMLNPDKSQDHEDIFKNIQNKLRA